MKTKADFELYAKLLKMLEGKTISKVTYSFDEVAKSEDIDLEVDEGNFKIIISGDPLWVYKV